MGASWCCAVLQAEEAGRWSVFPGTSLAGAQGAPPAVNAAAAPPRALEVVMAGQMYRDHGYLAVSGHVQVCVC